MTMFLWYNTDNLLHIIMKISFMSVLASEEISQSEMWMCPEVTVELDSMKPCYCGHISSKFEASVILTKSCKISWKCVEENVLRAGLS